MIGFFAGLIAGIGLPILALVIFVAYAGETDAI